MAAGGRWTRWNPQDSGRKPQAKVLLRLVSYGWRHKALLIGAFLSTAGAALTAVAVPRILGIALDETLSSGIQKNIFVLAMLMLAVSGLRALLGYAQNYLSEAVSLRAAFDIRNDFFRKLQNLSFGFHDRQQTGNLMSRATADVEASRRFISMALIRGLNIILIFGAVIAVMMSVNWRLSFVCLLFIPVLIWRAMYLSRRLRGTWMKVQVETGHMTTVLQENISGVRVVKAFGGREIEESKFEEKAVSLADHTYRATRLFASQGSLMMFIFTLAIAAILWFGGSEVVQGRLTPGDLAAFLLYMGMLLMPVGMVGFLINMMSRASSAGQRIMEILDAKSPVEEKEDAEQMPRVEGNVRFEKVSFGYDVGKADIGTLHDIEFQVDSGQLVAILGGPGSGKSTIVHLLPRFYDVSSGRILIDGVDVRDVTLTSLRRNVGIVLQDVFIFGASIKDNIAYGVENASLDEIISASKVAQFHEFIQTLPNGYDTWVGERGITLSGGQRQRLAIARTVLMDPPILILDDSTSSVDMSTEYKLQSALSKIMENRTSFVIAHRLSTVRRADVVLVVDKGSIVESGTHSELFAQDGLYRQIHDLQLKTQEEKLSDV